jgi:hypothetical protein
VKIEARRVRLFAELYHESEDDAVVDSADGPFQARGIEAVWSWWQGCWHLHVVSVVQSDGARSRSWDGDAEGPDGLDAAPSWLTAWAIASEPREAPESTTQRSDRRGGTFRCSARDARTGNRCAFDPSMTGVPPSAHRHRDANGAQFTVVRP